MNERARDLLNRYVDGRTPDAERQAAAWNAVQARLEAGDVGPEFTEDPSAAAAAGRTGLLAKGFLVGLAVAALGLAGAQLLDEPDPGAAEANSAPVSVESPRTAALKPASPDIATVTPATEGASDPAPVDAPPRERRRPRVAESVAPPADDPTAPTDAEQPASTLAAEMKLLSRGQAALKRGDATQALVLFEEHARRYPHGALADERRLKQAQTLCALGRVEEARRMAQELVAAMPESPLAGKAARICREPPP